MDFRIESKSASPQSFLNSKTSIPLYWIQSGFLSIIKSEESEAEDTERASQRSEQEIWALSSGKRERGEDGGRLLPSEAARTGEPRG